MSAEPAADMIPLPRPSALTRPFWDACREGRLVVQRCRDCGHHVFIPQPCCTACQAQQLEWVASSGRGRVYSYTVVHRPPRPQFEAPYVVAVIAMEEGWHMLSNLVDCAPDAVRVDLPVQVVFRRMTDKISLPCFALQR